MGGKVFELVKMPNGGPPEVPRMSPDLYKKVIADCQPKLQALFRNVVVPRDVVGKIDHGDVDFLVEGILSTTPAEAIWETTKTRFGAELHVPRNQSQSFGIPHPEISGAFVQVDVELSPGSGTSDSAELFEWTKFMKGDADLLQIIGIAHRPLGITCNDRGLHLRLEQIEPYDKKKALLFLTRDPVQAMQFYGFDVDKYHKGFEDETDLFDWVAAGRFFSSEIFERRVERSDDRSRHSKRPMYRHFVDDYMPKTHRGTGNAWSRESVLCEAIKTFGVHAEYDAMMTVHLTKVAEEELWKEVKAVIPAQDKALAAAVRALRRRVVFSNGKPRIADTPTLPGDYIVWAEHVSESSKNDVLMWVEKNWREVKSRDKAGMNAAREA
ncbi:uncharacterized protein EKO05_0009899 [Ascochyta rabiei]|uniref:uncharacterized protein n=1 Tax=Didymella rabiei TaxID=5454 RepID=UPI001902A074|nr:uncharacterized protein EKO05_0009899 [Ascochyta rabiei]UPX19643.1 hypothetical protein EKO05_0009899 [Ascochyta rabiei]